MTIAQCVFGVVFFVVFGSAQERLRGAGFVELDMAEERFGAVQAPPQAKHSEPDVETRLTANEPLERSAVLRHSGQRQLVREEHESEDSTHAQSAQQGNPQPTPGLSRSSRMGGGLRHRSHERIPSSISAARAARSPGPFSGTPRSKLHRTDRRRTKPPPASG